MDAFPVAVLSAGIVSYVSAMRTLGVRKIAFWAFGLGAAFCTLALLGTHPYTYVGYALLAILAGVTVAIGLDDAFRGRISNVVTYPAMVALLILGSFVNGIQATLVGGLVCGGILFFYGWFGDMAYSVISRGKIKLSAVGLGDVKAAIVVGLAARVPALCRYSLQQLSLLWP
jgi:hypothetical protein